MFVFLAKLNLREPVAQQVGPLARSNCFIVRRPFPFAIVLCTSLGRSELYNVVTL